MPLVSKTSVLANTSGCTRHSHAVACGLPAWCVAASMTLSHDPVGQKETALGSLALGVRYQLAIGQRMALQLDECGAIHESRDEGCGARVELRYHF